MFRLAACAWVSPPTEAKEDEDDVGDKPMGDDVVLDVLLLPPVSEGSCVQRPPPRPPRGESGSAGAAPR